jgi:hypothetical protein
VRASPGLALLVATVCVGAGLVACFDLFHSTSDIRTACQIDAQTPGCQGASPDGGAEAGIDFCAWSSPEARQNAQHACAWLGACETPMGRNAFGSCLFEALLAYDCAANPDHPARGKTHDLWACLSTAQTCANVDACVFPRGPQPCENGGDYTACGTASGPTGDNDDVRVECNNGGVTHGENCALWAQTCAYSGVVGLCAGGRDAGSGCSSECFGSALHWCVDGGDVGIDCADNGAGACGGFPTAGAATWLACLPSSDAGACGATATATCSSGIARSCAAGAQEAIDCDELLQAVDACVPGALSPPFDWTSPCRVESGTDGGTCVEACNGSVVSGCERGVPATVDCASVGLGACRMVTTDDGTETHPACAPP